MPHEPNGALPEKPKAPAPAPTPSAKTRKVTKYVRVTIDVSDTDADDMDEVRRFADELAAKLELKVTLGGVVLPAHFCVQPSP